MFVERIEKSNTSSARSTEKARGWISNCTTKHRRCGTGSPTPLPKRVIDVVRNAPDVVLVENENAPDRYLALSHCWGKDRMIVTNGKDLERYKERISFNSLPQTFQDAVIYCRKLSITYLWIDSLCIIQE